MTDQTIGLPDGSSDVAVNAEDEVISYTNAQGRLTICIPSCGKIKPNHQPSPGPIGNTVGIVVPQTSPNASGAGNSAPTPKPTEAEEGWWSSWGSDLTHGLLDIVGLIPLAGELADGLNGLIYLAEGDKVNAGLSFAMMLPVGGQAATAAKWGKKGIEAAEEAASRAAKEKAEREAKEEAKDGGWIDAPKNEKPRTGSSKNEKHGDNGRATTKADKQIEKLEKQKEEATSVRERKQISQKIKNIKRDAARKAKGEEHSRTRKR